MIGDTVSHVCYGDHGVQLGTARPAGSGYQPWVRFFGGTEDLDHVTPTDVWPLGLQRWGTTTQGDSIAVATHEAVAHLRALNASRAASQVAAAARELERERAIAAVLAEIPAAVDDERRRVRADYIQGINEGAADGYDPYASWLSAGSLHLLGLRAPGLAARLRAAMAS